MWRLIVAVTILSACSAGEASTPDEPTTTVVLAPEPTDPPLDESDDGAPELEGVQPEGYERVRATVTGADGMVCEVCLWLADNGDRRARGLMFVTDLGPADGMAFVYPRPHRGNFWMKNTILSLSIAFFDPDGLFLEAFDMEPCTSDSCRRYPTPDDFLVAIEVVQGGLGDLAIGPGSRLDLTGLSCDDA